MHTGTTTATSCESRPEKPPLLTGHNSEIEGLRAVAVTVVLLYHARVPGFGGGYVGVDVFFALSGFLMTGLLVSEYRGTGTISLRSFYARRIRRLLPGAVLVLTLTTVASWVVMSGLAFKRTAADAVSAGLYVINLRFASQATDYLGPEIDRSPVLHYWSLAIEEQFYVFWPLAMWLVHRLSKSTIVPVAFLIVVSLLSFLVALRLTADVQPRAFFGTHARVWEFGAGGLAAFAAVHVRRLQPAPNPALGWIGLGLIVFAVVTYGANTKFPGTGAVLPVVGTLLVLLAGSAVRGPTLLLSAKVMQWTGQRSYAIYLWHWPPLILIPVALDRPTTIPENGVIVLVASLCAVSAHRFVEMPMRFSPWLMARSTRSYVVGLALTAAAVAVPWGLSRTVEVGGTGGLAGELDRGAVSDHAGPMPVPANLLPPLAAVADDRPLAYVNGCHVGQRETEPALPCRFGDETADRTMVLFGDSHMAQWSTAFDVVGLETGWQVVSLTKSACPSVTIDVFNTNFDREYTECRQWREATFDVITALDPDIVVLANYPSRAGQRKDAERSKEWLSGLEATVRRLQTSDTRVVVMGPSPIPGEDIPDCISGNMSDSRPCDLERSAALSSEDIEREARLAKRTGATYIDVTEWLCGRSTCPAVLGKYLVYRDASHIATPYVEWLAPELQRAFEQAVW